MSSLSVNVQQKFTNLRKKLDQLGYMQPLSVESLPLVESLLTDFVWTTESFRKCKSELDKRAELRERVEEHVEPYKADNGRLASEHNRAQKRIIEMRLEHDETVRDLNAQIRHLEQQKYDLLLFNQQCLDKINKYEFEAKQMVQKIMLLQEKNFQAVVHTPEGKRKQIPFRRQRMDIDCFIPSNDFSKHEDYCCAVSRERSESKTQSDSYSSDQSDLLQVITNKCKELSQQLCRAEEELELSDRKINNYCDKLKMYEDEIYRLSRELCGGRSLEAVSLDGYQRTRDRLADQLNMQIELLQQRNEELEKEILHLNAVNIRDGKISTSIQSINPKENDCMLQLQNEKLRHRIEELVEREKCILKELRSANSKLAHNKSDCIPVIEESLDKEVVNLHKHMKALEDDRNYWRQEAESRSCERQSVPSRDRDEICDIKDELAYCRQEMSEIICQNDKLREMLNVADTNNTSPNADKDRSRNVDAELKRCRAERDSLQDLLNKFERQLHDIQGNIRVLTQERDMLTERYQECQKELHDMRQTIIQSDRGRKDGGGQNSLAAQSLLRRLELEREDSLSDLHKMTTERDSLRERLKTVTETALSEKARLCQRLEDCENQKERLCQDKEEMIEKLSILRNKLGELEEYNHQLIKRNDSLTCNLEKERSNLQNMAIDIQRFENEIQDKERIESQLSDELKGTENRLMTLQQRTESQNEELTNLRNDCVRLKEILNDVDQEKDQMQNEVDAKSEELRDLQSQLKIKEDALDEVRMSMSILEQQLRRIQEVNNHRDKESRALVIHNEQLENDLRHEVSKCDQLKAESCRLEEDLMSLTREHHILESDFRDAKRCILNLNEEKDQLEQRLVYYQSSESDQQNQTDELLGQYRELSLENDKLQLSLQRTESLNEELTSEVEARENIIRTMREQLLQAEGDIANLQSNLRHLEDQVSNLRQVLGTNNEITENHSLEKQEIIQELSAMRDLCTRLENHKDNIQRQLSSRLLELEQLKAENTDIIKENENLREEIVSLQENIRSLETVMSAGREKEYRNQMECQERIAELETQLEQLVHVESKIEQMCRDLNKSNVRNSELDTECERVKRQLTSERFKLELANQELLRRQRIPTTGFTPDRERCNENDLCERFEARPNENEYYSSSSGIQTGRSFANHTPTTSSHVLSETRVQTSSPVENNEEDDDASTL